MAIEFWRCGDGSFVEPLDTIHGLFFPNRGYTKPTTVNVCFQPRYFNLSFITRLLPERGDLFTPDDLVDGLAALTVICTFVFVAIVAAKYIWEHFDPSFKAISPSHKKWYVVANMSKGFWLLCLLISPKYWVGIYRCFVLDKFQLIELKRSMAVYIATDVCALYLVPKLPFSTVMHHIVTTLLTIVTFSVNVGMEGYIGILGVSKMTVLYGSWSVIPFAVNWYLALRVVYPKSAVVNVLRLVALVTYIICCIVNWSTHLYWLLSFGDLSSIFSIVYIALLLFIVRDDVVLILWLLSRSSPMSENKKKD